MKIVDGLFTSKIRYGVQLLGRVRTSESVPTNGDIDEIQIIQNKLVRMLTNTRLQDKVNRVTLMQATNMLSVNQINAQIEIQEIWKSLNIMRFYFLHFYISQL